VLPSCPRSHTDRFLLPACDLGPSEIGAAVCDQFTPLLSTCFGWLTFFWPVLPLLECAVISCLPPWSLM
jgi:hypothetical protein